MFWYDMLYDGMCELYAGEHVLAKSNLYIYFYK